MQVNRPYRPTLRSTEHYAGLSTAFGEETVFDLRGLLVERTGSNLRNVVAHGLLSQDQFFSGPTVYFWWLTLRLCVIAWYNATLLGGSADDGS